MITVTDKAKEKIGELLQQEGRTPQHNVRVSVRRWVLFNLIWAREYKGRTGKLVFPVYPIHRLFGKPRPR